MTKQKKRESMMLRCLDVDIQNIDYTGQDRNLLPERIVIYYQDISDKLLKETYISYYGRKSYSEYYN